MIEIELAGDSRTKFNADKSGVLFNHPPTIIEIYRISVYIRMARSVTQPRYIVDDRVILAMENFI